MNSAPLKVSYCTTCRGRLPHLKQTLPANLAAEKDNPNVEFVVLDYGDEGKDGNLGEWIKQTFPEELVSGRLRYARFEAPHFAMAHAKNMAHRLATGDIVCNVDADNFIVSGFGVWLSEQFSAHPNTIATRLSFTVEQEVQLRTRQLYNSIKQGKLDRIGSTAGRTAMLRETFEKLGGYDQNYEAWGYEDSNLLARAHALGIGKTTIPKMLAGSGIDHNHALRYEHMSNAARALSKKRLHQSFPVRLTHLLKTLNEQHDNPVANFGDQAGCGAVHVNFSDQETVIEPLSVSNRALGDTEAAADVLSSRRINWSQTLGIRPAHETTVPHR